MSLERLWVSAGFLGDEELQADFPGLEIFFDLGS